MRIEDGGELVFTGQADHDFLKKVLWRCLDPIFRARVEATRIPFARYSGNNTMIDETPTQELRDLIAAAQDKTIEQLGLKRPENTTRRKDPTAREGYKSLLRWMALGDHKYSVEYVLPARWTPVIMMGASAISNELEWRESEVEAARLNYPSRMLTDVSDEEARQIFEDADRLAEEGEDLLENDEESRQQRLRDAHEQLAIAEHAGGILLKLVNRYEI